MVNSEHIEVRITKKRALGSADIQRLQLFLNIDYYIADITLILYYCCYLSSPQKNMTAVPGPV